MPGSYPLGGIILRLRPLPSPRLTCLVMTPPSAWPSPAGSFPPGGHFPACPFPSWCSLGLVLLLGTPNNTDPDMPKKQQNSPLRPRVTSLEKGSGGLMKERISGGCSPPDLMVCTVSQMEQMGSDRLMTLSHEWLPGLGPSHCRRFLFHMEK